MSAKSLALGVLGVGPATTLDFLQRLQAFTPAQSDRDHLRVLVDVNPKVPDLDLAGSGAGAALAEMAGALRGAGAEVLALTSSAAHAHADLIQRASGLPLLNLIETGASAARDAGARRVGVLGDKGTLRLYREYLAAQAMGLVTPPLEGQAALTAAIGRIQAGDLGPAVRRKLAELTAELAAEGAEVAIAGCAEIPLALRRAEVRLPIIDPAQLLARRCVAVCLGMEPAPAAPA